MEAFADYLGRITSSEQRLRMENVLQWVCASFPDLMPRVAWNQPMFTHHGTFIIGFSVAKRHMAVAPERAAIDRFAAEIAASGYQHTRELFRIPWLSEVDYDLLRAIIAFNMEDKVGCSSFWRKPDGSEK